MEVQPQLVLLQKTLLNIEGLGRQLDPDLDLWQTAKPFLDRWMSEQVGMRALVKGLRTHLPKALEQAPELPALIHQYFKLADQEPDIEKKLLRQEIELLQMQFKRQQRFTLLILLLGVGAAWVFAWYF